MATARKPAAKTGLSFAYTEEQELLREAVREFVAREMAPLAQEADEHDVFPLDLFRRMGEMGFLGLMFPEAYGGAGAGHIDGQIMLEEMAYASAGIALGVFAHLLLACKPILILGSERQKARYLVPGLRGEQIGAWGLTEPDVGSDVAALKTRAMRERDGWVLNGAKMFITNGPIADFVVVAARTDLSQGMRGISLFVVDKGTPGFSVGKKLKKVSVRGSETAELVFSNCRVPDDALLGPLNEGFYEAMKTLQGGRVIGTGYGLGIARAAFDAAMRYAKERVQFGQAIAKFQVIQHRLAEMATQIEAARALGQRAAWLADEGLPCVKEASMAKLFASEMCTQVCNMAVQLHGGYGLMMEYDVQRFWRDAKLLEIGEGTSEIQKGIIAKQLGL